MDSENKKKLKELHGEIELGNQTKDQTKIWYEMKSTIKNLGSTDKAALLDELEFTADLLREDANNKYAWSYRQRVLDLLGKGCADELGFCNEILLNNNNIHIGLVWDQRYFALQKCLGRGWTFARPSEAKYATAVIMVHPEYENPWRYLRLLYKNDMESLAVNHHLQWALVCVFTQARDSAIAVTVDSKLNKKHNKHDGLLDSINKRGCLFALDLISDLLKHGYQPNKEAKVAIEELFQGYGSTFGELVDSVLLSHRMGVLELCADFKWKNIDMAGGIKSDPPSISGSIQEWESLCLDDGGWISFSELCGVAGFSPLPIRVFFHPEENERSLLTRVGTGFGWPENYVGTYSDLPEEPSLRCLDMDRAEYTDSYLDDHSQEILFFEGHKNNPTVWQFRRLVIEKCNLSFEDEVQFLELLSAGSAIYCYLFWHHRRWVSEKIGTVASAKKEFEFTVCILSSEPYNYHAWSHRQWVASTLAIGKKIWWEAELEFCDKILEKDASNCFAWNQRYFVSKEHPRLRKMRDEEIKYCVGKIMAEGDDEMPWRYLSCLMAREKKQMSLRDVISEVKEHMKESEKWTEEMFLSNRNVGFLRPSNHN